MCQADNFKWDIFLSYSRKDHAQVLKIYNTLFPHYKVWFDDVNMINSSNVVKAISEGIKNSKVFMCCLSPDYQTEGSNSMKEFYFASKNLNENRILPVKLDKSFKIEDVVDYHLGSIHHLSLANDNYDNLMKKLTNLLPKKSDNTQIDDRVNENSKSDNDSSDEDPENDNDNSGDDQTNDNYKEELPDSYIKLDVKEVDRAKRALTKSWDIFLSYSRANGEQVKQIYDYLANDYKVWFNDVLMKFYNTTTDGMTEGITNSNIFICCLSEEYLKKRSNSMEEFDFAIKKKKKILPIKLDKKYQIKGNIEFLLGKTIHLSLVNNDFDKLFGELKAKLTCILQVSPFLT